MAKLPLLISVPHAGLAIPQEVRDYCRLSMDDIVADGDEGAQAIYFGLQKYVEVFLTTDVARAIVDLNRSVADRSKDGVVKTHTCWEIPVYQPFPPEEVISLLVSRYYSPYHRAIEEAMVKEKVVLGIDCHTMASIGPPVGPDPGMERPLVCLSNREGVTSSPEMMSQLAQCFEPAFGVAPACNHPFKGGFICRQHSKTLPWVQLELSRTDALSHAQKASAVLDALEQFCQNCLSD